MRKHSRSNSSYDQNKLKFQVERDIKIIIEGKERIVVVRKILPFKMKMKTLELYKNFLTLQNIKKRICRSLFRKKVNFDKIIFSDECRFAYNRGSIMLYGSNGFPSFLFLK